MSSAQPVENVTLINGDCLEWLSEREPRSLHAVVTDPPYALVEYSSEHIAKRTNGKGGIWRLPPSYDGWKRQPLPRFTTLSKAQTKRIHEFFCEWARLLKPTLVPGAHVMVASTPLLSFNVSRALADAGFERRGTVVRLVHTLRGGDRPKNAEEEFPDVSVMPRAGWEPWLLFRVPLEGTVAANLREWGTGALRRGAGGHPFSDVIQSGRASAAERKLAPHPSLKPQDFLRQVVRAILPLGEGVVLDPFSGSGAISAAAAAVGYNAIGVELDPHYYEMSVSAVPDLVALTVKSDTPRPATPPRRASKRS